MNKRFLFLSVFLTVGLFLGAQPQGTSLPNIFNYTAEELTNIVNHKQSRVKLTKIEIDSVNAIVSGERYLYFELCQAIKNSIVFDQETKKVIKRADKGLTAKLNEIEEDVSYRIAELLGPDKFRAFRLTLLDEYDRRTPEIGRKKK